jgi:hypothetical protein
VISSGEDSGENSVVIMEEDNGEEGVMQGCEQDPDQRPEQDSQESDEMTVDEEDHAPPAAASTPQRAGTQLFRIVDIERPLDTVGQGDGNSTGESGIQAAIAAGPISSDVNSAKNSGDDNSTKDRNLEVTGAKDIPPRSDDQTDRQRKDVSKAAPPTTESGCGAGGKVPSMVPPPKIPPKLPPKTANTEKDATPSETYKSILAAKSSHITPAAIPGTGSGVADTSCGSFYNPGDNRIRRAVYKENVANLTVTSMSFNPVT